MNLIRTLILSLIVTYSSFGQSVVQIPNSIGGEQNSLGISEEYVAFSKDVDGKIELYLWNIDENITTRLTNNNYFSSYY